MKPIAFCIALLLSLMMVSGAVAERVDLSYAEQFSIEHLENGCTLLTVAGMDRYLLVPEGESVPEDTGDATILRQPVDQIYLAATSAMDLFRALGRVDAVTLSGTQQSGWFISEAVQAMEEGKMRYAGKYSAPDFEMIVDSGCQLAIESTMIYHSPDVKEQLEALGVPVLVERSSYESHPLGRVEWLKFYGALLDCEEEADRLFQMQVDALVDVAGKESSEKQVAFFFINSMGLVNVRKPSDYIVRVIELAGGQYALAELQDDGNALSTLNMQMEDFYASAVDADVLIYNSAINGEVADMKALLAKNALLADFKAVKTGQVYCTEQHLFQESAGLGALILDIHRVLNGQEEEGLTYLFRLE